MELNKCLTYALITSHKINLLFVKGVVRNLVQMFSVPLSDCHNILMRFSLECKILNL